MVLPSVAEAPRGATRRRWLLPACVAILSSPLLVALAGFRRDTWTPVLDLAMTELRVRDVGGAHSPLIGLPGRIGTIAQQGSHPGPASFYALAPVYRLLGSTAWALQAATVVIHMAAIAVALWIARRRGGHRLLLGVALLLAALSAGYGGGALTEPWNPYLPLLWWVVALLAVWSVLCGDLALLPVVVVAASFCAQTHVPYLGLALGMGALAVGGAAAAGRSGVVPWRAVLRWGAISGGLGVLLWLPPSIDQLRHDPGNFRQLIDHFSDPPEETKGISDGIEVGLRYFDLAHLVRADVTDPGWLVTSADGNRPTSSRGLVLVVIWAASAALAVRRRYGVLMRLHLVVGSGLVLMVLAISRIFGVVWYYLTLWGWAIGLLALLAAVWTLARAVGDRSTPVSPRSGPVLETTVAVLVLVVAARFSVDAWNSPHADASVAAELALVVDDVARGLDAGEGAATGRTGTYLVTWDDAFHIGSQGFGLLNELERRGFDAGVEDSKRVPATPDRVLAPAAVTARVHLVTGTHIDRWRRVAGAVEIAFVDPRSGDARREQQRLRGEVIDTLRGLGLSDLVAEVDDNLFGAAIDERVPEATQLKMGRMLELGAPMAIFVLPPDTVDP
ncbi:MAG: hypothetical protein ACT4OV_07590 [Microthrixaceae bacterium]